MVEGWLNPLQWRLTNLRLHDNEIGFASNTKTFDIKNDEEVE